MKPINTVSHVLNASATRQGCTKAAMGAVILDSALRSAGASTDLPPDLSSYFFAKHHAIVKGIW